jgi:hypothetical protein
VLAGREHARSHHRIARYVVDPVHVEAMRSAFHKVCRLLQRRDDADDPVIDLIVTKIVEHAKAGELDPDLLCSQVLLDVWQHGLPPGPLSPTTA